MTKAIVSSLEQWRADEERVRRRITDKGIGNGVAQPHEVMGKTGMQLFEAMLAGELPRAPISDTLDFILLEAEYGRAVFQGRPTLLDSAVGCAVHTTMPVGRGYTTLEIKVNMVRALTDKVPLVRAEGKVIHSGRQSATAEGKLYDADGKLYAHATTTCLVFEMPMR
jgi:uncharacterized protein (TIGR00369 family)